MNEPKHPDPTFEERLRAHYRATSGDTRSSEEVWERVSAKLGRDGGLSNLDGRRLPHPGYEPGAMSRPGAADERSFAGIRKPRLTITLAASLVLAVGSLVAMWLAVANRREGPVPPQVTAPATSTARLSGNAWHRPGEVITDVVSSAWILADFNGHITRYLFESGTDESVSYMGSPAAFIRMSAPAPEGVAGIASLQQSVPLTGYMGTRIRLSAYLKVENVEKDAGLWMEATNLSGASLRRADTWDRPILGTADWQRYELVVDLPEGSEQVRLAFGARLESQGTVWISKVRVEVVGEDVPINAKRPPYNPSFEEGERGWYLSSRTGMRKEEQAGLDYTVSHTGSASAYVATGIFSGTVYATNLWGGSQRFAADEYRGKRVRFSMYVRTEAVGDMARLSLRISRYAPAAPARDIVLGYDDMNGRLISGTNDWQKHDLVLDIPEEANVMEIGFYMRGDGRMWVDDAQLEIVGDDIPTTGMNVLREPRNLSFEDGMSGWFALAYAHEVRIDRSAARDGQASASIRGKGDEADEVGLLHQTIFAQRYRGKRVRVSAYIKASGDVEGAVLLVESAPVDARVQRDEIPIENANGWRRYEQVVDVPPGTLTMRFGITMLGNEGQIWLDDLRLEELGPAQPTPTWPTIP